MKIIVFGAGPMTGEPAYAVMAPGARTWQIAATVAGALARTHPDQGQVVVCGLEPHARTTSPAGIEFRAGGSPLRMVAADGRDPVTGCLVQYHPFDYETYSRLPETGHPALDGDLGAVIGCASAQPCATAAAFAAARRVPLWIDVFGDPLAEVQTKAQLEPEKAHDNDMRSTHVWKLMLPALLQGDRFSALSSRQRQALIGQLGCAGRLNRHTTGCDLVSVLPFGLLPCDAPEMPPPTGTRRSQVTIMWCGSFNTWMDVDTLVEGLIQAFRAEERLRLLVVGGRIPGYNETSYERFSTAIENAGLSARVRLNDWVPLAELQRLYATCDAGLSIDRPSYEAYLGSRTRLVHFLAAGKPVISTVCTELSEDLAARGFLLPFRVGDAEDLSRVLVETVGRASDLPDLGRCGRDFVLQQYNTETLGTPLASWLANPTFAPDKQPDGTHLPDNPLIAYWTKALSVLP
ncbi:MAG: glycosyltransferase [Candidatus Sumerlaeaceae bacterium]|nr:glycosyltransferase [Candidatus Sumerlaeaceae bacterium]